MSPWLKAGLVGAAVLVVLDLVGLIPCACFVTCILIPLTYAGTGVLTAYWMPPTRDAGAAAGQGALAGVIAALIGGLVNILVLSVQGAIVGVDQALSQIPPEFMDQIDAAGLDPSLFAGPTGGAISGSLCCGGGLLLAAILAAIGGAIYAAVKPD
jgi:hypothetical protein